jgi:hypothetical protein
MLTVEWKRYINDYFTFPALFFCFLFSHFTPHLTLNRLYLPVLNSLIQSVPFLFLPLPLLIPSLFTSFAFYFPLIDYSWHFLLMVLTSFLTCSFEIQEAPLLSPFLLHFPLILSFYFLMVLHTHF